MNQEEAIAVASAWVKERYPTVPPIARARQFTEDVIAQMLSDDVFELNPHLDNDEYRSDVEAWRGKWAIFYGYGWESVPNGMPESLRVLVDSDTRGVELMK